jgi:NhaA family Na+:H+ antiporter
MAMFEPVSLGIIIGLLIGKPLGIFSFGLLASKLGWCTWPSSISRKHLLGAGILGGVGFTMSIFITQIAFADGDTISTAKLAILITSMAAGLLGLFFLSRQKQA